MRTLLASTAGCISGMYYSVIRLPSVKRHRRSTRASKADPRIPHSSPQFTSSPFVLFPSLSFVHFSLFFFFFFFSRFPVIMYCSTHTHTAELRRVCAHMCDQSHPPVTRRRKPRSPRMTNPLQTRKPSGMNSLPSIPPAATRARAPSPPGSSLALGRRAPRPWNPRIPKSLQERKESPPKKITSLQFNSWRWGSKTEQPRIARRLFSHPTRMRRSTNQSTPLPTLPMEWVGERGGTRGTGRNERGRKNDLKPQDPVDHLIQTQPR